MTDRQIFLNSPADASPEVLAAYLKKACGDDEDLRARVEALIDADEEAGSFMDRSPLGFVAVSPAQPTTARLVLRRWPSQWIPCTQCNSSYVESAVQLLFISERRAA